MSILRFTFAAALVGTGIGSAHAFEFPANNAVPDARLDTIRGGYDLGDNLRASFALERTVLVNGVEAIRQSVKIPDVAQISIDQANALRSALSTVVVTNGAGGVAADESAPAAAMPPASVPAAITTVTATLPTGVAVATSTLPTNSAGLIVQNSVNDTSIMATTKIDAAVNTSAMLQNMRLDESIRDAVIQFRGN